MKATSRSSPHFMVSEPPLHLTHTHYVPNLDSMLQIFNNLASTEVYVLQAIRDTVNGANYVLSGFVKLDATASDTTNCNSKLQAQSNNYKIFTNTDSDPSTWSAASWTQISLTYTGTGWDTFYFLVGGCENNPTVYLDGFTLTVVTAQ